MGDNVTVTIASYESAMRTLLRTKEVAFWCRKSQHAGAFGVIGHQLDPPLAENVCLRKRVLSPVTWEGRVTKTAPGISALGDATALYIQHDTSLSAFATGSAFPSAHTLLLYIHSAVFSSQVHSVKSSELSECPILIAQLNLTSPTVLPVTSILIIVVP